MKPTFAGALAAFACTIALSFPASATTFAVDYDSVEQATTDDTFELDCGGAVEDETPDCAERAAALHAELVDLLASLSGESDAETVALFESVGKMNDPQLQEIALRYFAYHQETPADLWDKAREFFFGPEALVGRSAAELLKTSQAELDQQLADAYLEGRPTPNHGGDLPMGSGFDDSWALGCSQDAVLDALPDFEESEVYPDATRLLMLDRYLVDFAATDPDPQGVPVTAFVSSASLDDITAHFKGVFGADPYPPLSEIEARQKEISDEFQTLAQNPSGPDVAKRIQELYAELNKLQTALVIASRLGLDDEELASHVFWADLPASTATSEPIPRAVTLGTDTRVDGAVIRYYNGSWSDGASSGAPSGSRGDESSAPSAGDDAAGEGGAATRGSGHGSSGCDCSFARSSHLAGTSTLLLLCAGLLRRRRHVRPVRGR
jgi:hypothetical protein